MEKTLIPTITEIEFEKLYTYDITQILGEGGFGTVYLGKDEVTDKDVAVKRAEVRGTNENYSIWDEVNASKMIPIHKNIAIYESGYRVFFKKIGTFDFAIMQHYPDGNLAKYLKENIVSDDVKKEIITGVINGIEHLHTNNNQKILHRDLKPSNILIVKRANEVIVPKITDFGISKLLNRELKHSIITNTLTGGSFNYCSPEQLAGKSTLFFNADLWSLGIIIFEIFTGELPFDTGDGINEDSQKMKFYLSNIVENKLSNKIENISEPYKEIILKCLVYNPDERIKSITEVKDILNGKAKADELLMLLKQLNEAALNSEKLKLADSILAIEPENEKALNFINDFQEEQKTIVRGNLILVLNELIKNQDYQAVIATISKQDEAIKNSNEILATLKIAIDEIAKIETQTAIDNLIKNAIEYAEKNNFEEANNTLEEAIQKGCIDTQISDTKAKIEKYKSIFINTLLAEAKIKIDEKKVRQAKAKAKKVLLIDPNNEEAKNILAIKQAPINLKPIYYGAVMLIASIGIYWVVTHKPPFWKKTTIAKEESKDTLHKDSIINDAATKVNLPDTTVKDNVSIKKDTIKKFDYKTTQWYKEYEAIKSKISIAEKSKNYLEVVRLAEKAKVILKPEAKSELVIVDNLIQINNFASKAESQNKQNQEITKPKIGSKDNLTKVELNDRIKRLEQYDLQKYIRPDDSKFIFIKSKGTNGLWGALNYKDATIGIDFIYEKVDFSEPGYAIFIDKIGTKKKIKY